MQFGAIIFVVFVFSCVSKNANNREVKIDGSDTTKRPKFHPTYTNQLQDTVRTLELSYVAWFCQCANWVKASNHEKYKKSGGPLEKSMFIEPADTTLN